MSVNTIALTIVALASYLAHLNQFATNVAAAAAASSSGMWTPSGRLNEGRFFHATVVLADGRLLTIGGNSGPQRSAELYDPATRTWTPAAAMPHPVANPAAVVLRDDRVLVAGGSDGTGGAIDKTILYDTGSNSWVPGSPLLEPRRQGQVVALADGRVLLVGGDNQSEGLLDSVELYDGVSWRPGVPVPYRPGVQFSLTLLTDGRVLLAGGLATAFSSIASAALYDPLNDAWERLPDMSVPRLGHSATRLLDGRVLVAGGTTSSGTPDSVLRTTEIFNPATKTWTASGPMAARRNFHRAVRLLDGRVLVAGGAQFGGVDLREAELFYPQVSRWVEVAPMQHRRAAHTLTPFPDGSVLAVGGLDQAGQIGPFPALVLETELFTPGDAEPPPLDTTPPSVACSAEPAMLWPPNNELVPVTVKIEVKDDESGPAGFSLVAAVADEGDGARDIVDFTVGTADTAGSLRASRTGSGDRRTYSLVYEGGDVAGNTARCITTVTVPHDQRR
jgi:Kelch motif/Galactose oxidase, central domain